MNILIIKIISKSVKFQIEDKFSGVLFIVFFFEVEDGGGIGLKKKDFFIVKFQKIKVRMLQKI